MKNVFDGWIRRWLTLVANEKIVRFGFEKPDEYAGRTGSEAWFYSDYDEESNTVGISIYITNPLSVETPQPMNFNQLMSEYLIRADIANLPQVSNCLGRMKKKAAAAYEVDFISVHYTKKNDKYNIHFRITKNQLAQLKKQERANSKSVVFISMSMITTFYPKSVFEKKGETAKLCPNCHTHFHEYSKKRTTNPNDAQEARDIWDEWLTSVSILVTILVVGLLFYFF